MSKNNTLPSFPSMHSGDQANFSEANDWEHEKDDINKALNVLFLENLEEATKFSYAGLCAGVLQDLYSYDREFCHDFIASFVAHLCLPSNVTNTMQAFTDCENQLDTAVFVDSLKKDKAIKEDPLLLINDMVIWALTYTNGCYDARTRFVIRQVTWKMRIPYEDMECIEEIVIEKLFESSKKESPEEEATRLKIARNRKLKRYGLIAFATIGGGALIGLTGGLAAPLVAAGAGAILGGASAAALGSVAGIAIITSLFGAAGAGLTGYKMKKRVGSIDEFLFKPLTVSRQPKIVIAVSGWLSDDEDVAFTYTWRHLDQSKEQYTLIWESKHLMRLGNVFAYIFDTLVSAATTEALKLTILGGLIAAVAWPSALVAAASLIDNPWSVCLQRAIQVGRQLAEVLLAREQGSRPVTLIGYSLGGRVIYYCLEEMAKRKNHKGIVEDVFILGAPVTGKPEDWQKVGSVISGQITNAYCKTDWLLRFLYRSSAARVKVAGLGPIAWKDRRMMNVDVSSIVQGHLDYAANMDEILEVVGVRTSINQRFTVTETSDSTSSKVECDDFRPSADVKHNTEELSDLDSKAGAIVNLVKPDTVDDSEVKEKSGDVKHNTEELSDLDSKAGAIVNSVKLKTVDDSKVKEKGDIL